LHDHKTLVACLKENTLLTPGTSARDPLFNGTIYFAQITFHTSGGNFMIPTPDMNTIVQYAQHAIVPISEYAAQYGANSISVSPTVLQYTVNVPTNSYTDADLRNWVKDIASQYNLSTRSCVVIVSPQGLSASGVDGNAGYHGFAGSANIPYIVLGVFAQTSRCGMFPTSTQWL
jgi:hypothetical protein